jgi:hypothetical protein
VGIALLAISALSALVAVGALVTSRRSADSARLSALAAWTPRLDVTIAHQKGNGARIKLVNKGPRDLDAVTVSIAELIPAREGSHPFLGLVHDDAPPETAVTAQTLDLGGLPVGAERFVRTLENPPTQRTDAPLRIECDAGDGMVWPLRFELRSRAYRVGGS